MKKFLFFKMTFIFLVQFYSAEAQTFQKVIFGSGVTDVLAYADNSSLVCGQRSGGGYLVRLNSAGDTLWTKAYAGTAFYKMNHCNDGGSIIAGNTSQDVNLTKFDSTGNIQWSKSFVHQSAAEVISAYDVMQTSESQILVTGRIWRHSTIGSEFLIIKVRANGDTIWTRSFLEGNKEAYGYSISETNDHKYMVAGMFNNNACLIKLDTNGNILWAKQYYSGFNSWFYNSPQNSGGHFLTIGSIEPQQVGSIMPRNMLFADIDSNGTAITSKAFGVSHMYFPRKGILYDDNSVIACGDMYSTGSIEKLFISKIGIGGNVVWNETSPTLQYYGIASLVSVSSMPDSGILFSGYTNQFDTSGTQSVLMKADQYGNGLCNFVTTNVSSSTIYLNDSSINLTVTPPPFNFIDQSAWQIPFTFSMEEYCNLLSVENESTDRIQVYPNPFSSGFTISDAPANSSLSIFDVAGKLVYRQTLIESNNDIKPDVPAGFYFLTIQNQSYMYTNKIIRN
jgi:hypothetical protein